MNRRNFLKTVGGTVVLGVSARTVSATTQKEVPITNTLPIEGRRARYKYYEVFLGSLDLHHEYVLEPIAKKILKNLDLRNEEEKRNFSLHTITSALYDTALYGDWFATIYPAASHMMWYNPANIYRIENTKRKVVEFQFDREGPDYKALSQKPLSESDGWMLSETGMRHHPDYVIHIRPFCQKYYPYGTSAMEVNKYSQSTKEINDMFGPVDPPVLRQPLLDQEFENEVTKGLQEGLEKFRKLIG